MVSLTGQSIGRYQILEQIGKGGMAIVYKAQDTRLERDVAVKVILPGREQSGNFQKRFERETKTQARLNHPNIVKVLDFGEHGNLPYLVMEYQPGGTLKNLMGRPMQWQAAARLLVPIASALDYIHRQGTIHRDIKPANILMSQSGQPMLSDFGITKILDTEETAELTGTGIGIGTPEYMAPEQGQGLSVDYRADIYSLGVVFYELITGRKPFSADTPMMILHKQITEPLISPRKFVPNVPLEVEHVLLKALGKKPEDRYQDTGNFVNDLKKIAEGEKIYFGLNDANEATIEEATLNEETIDQSTIEEATIGKVSIVEMKDEKPAWLAWAVGGAGIGFLGLILIMAVIGAILLLKANGNNNPADLSSIPSSPIIYDPSITPFQQTGVNVRIEAATENPVTLQPDPTRTINILPTLAPGTYSPLPDCSASRIHAGDSIYVSFEGGDNAIRSTSDLHSSSNKTSVATSGDVLTIIGGPVCSYGWIVWEVRTSSGKTGWTPESDGTSFWLVPIKTWQACSGAPKSRLHIGDSAFVDSSINLPNRVRTGAGKSFPVQFEIFPNEYVNILEGPSCADGLVWWKIISQNNSLSGWTAEGDSSDFWLVPVIKRP